MKRRLIVVLTLLAVAVGFGFFLWQRRDSSVTKQGGAANQDNQTNASPIPLQQGVEEMRIPAPLLPAEAARRLAAEQKWARKHNAPVVFYAKVVDQFGTPVPRVFLTATLSVFDEGLFVNDKDRVQETKLQILSDAQGLFDLKRDKGSTLRLNNLEKDGYLWTYPDGLGSFDFGVNRPKMLPDYANPNKRFTLFVWKKGATESVIRQQFRIRIAPEREEYGLDLLNGQVVAPGQFSDLVIKVPLVADGKKAARGERLFVFEVPNGGILETSDVYPYAAPKEGYQQNWRWLFQPADTPPGAEGWKRNFYVKTRDERVFAGIRVVFDFGSPAFIIEVITNPNGSPILEPDPSKQITDPEEIRRLDAETRPK